MTKKSKEDKKAAKAKAEALKEKEKLEEEKEKLIIKYLGMAYSFDVASQLADEELGLKND